MGGRKRGGQGIMKRKKTKRKIPNSSEVRYN
jgi:hypothetical protein